MDFSPVRRENSREEESLPSKFYSFNKVLSEVLEVKEMMSFP